MNLTDILTAIDDEIAKLQHARALLSGGESVARKKLGRPKTSASGSSAPKKRVLTAAGRKAIAAAVKARWARVKAAKK